MDITLKSTGRTLPLKSYKVSDQERVDELQRKALDGHGSVIEMRKQTVLFAYPELKDEIDDWEMAELSELYVLLGRYIHGGPDAIKNSSASGDGGQE